MSITVIKPGMLSTFQDLGRTGYQHQGIPVAGAMDPRAHRIASLLAGNDPARTASLEITLTGPTLRFEAACCFALAGAQLGAALNDHPIPNHRPLVARPGDVLSFGAPAQGVRAYLAVHGGFDIAPVMQSQSTYLRSGFGGLEGRALRKGDRIPLLRRLELETGSDESEALEMLAAALWAQRIYLPAAIVAPPRAALRVTPGRQWHLYTAQSQADFLDAAFTVSPQSDRMGYRLQGPALHMTTPVQMLSEAACFGTVQVPGDGAPIVLMVDRQTTGGYPKIAQIAQVDLPHLAQTAPGEKLHFEMITLAEAQRLDAEREAAFMRLAEALGQVRACYAQHFPAPASSTV